MSVHPKFQGKKIATGLYLQPHDDGTTYSVIARAPYPNPDGRDTMRWFYGEIERAEIEAIAHRAADPSVDEADLLIEFEGFAQHGPWDTKREAIDQALGLVAAA